MHFLPENRMCAPPFVTKQRPPIWKILDPPLLAERISSNLRLVQLVSEQFVTEDSHIHSLAVQASSNVPLIPHCCTPDENRTLSAESDPAFGVGWTQTF